MKTIAENLFDKLKQGETLFAYKKKSNGEVRPTLGTLNKNFIPKEFLKFKDKNEDPTLNQDLSKSIVYFDLKKKAWRSCVISNLLDL